MVAAARPGSSDARVPCPLCGGLIHPIAGKCKHCKADLTAYRAARPAANAPLPALHPGPAVAGAGAAQGNGHAIHAPTAHAVAMPSAYDAAHPVLPPRPTGHVATPPAGTWRTWPILVIVVAMLAIVAAVVLMVWPVRHDRDGKRVLQPPPAPERMDTQTPPVIPRSDPPAAPRPAPQVAPQDPSSPPPSDPPHNPGAAQADPDDDPDSDALDPGPTRHQLTLNTGGQVALAVTTHLCRKLAQCGGNSMNQSTCDAIARLPAVPPPAACPALRRCLRQIDTLDCTPDPMRAGMQLLRLGDCADAVHC